MIHKAAVWALADEMELLQVELPGKMAVHLAETALWDSHLRSRQMPMEINWLCRSHQVVREVIVKATNTIRSCIATCENK